MHAYFDFEDVAYCQGRFTDEKFWQISHALTGFDFRFSIQVYGTKGTAWLAMKEDDYFSLDSGVFDHWAILRWAPLDTTPPWRMESRRCTWHWRPGDPTEAAKLCRSVD